MDPGNWATDLAGGAAHGYALLWIVGLSSLMAMLLQVLSARLGIVAQADLAQLCRRHSSRRSALAQWLLCELAICACDLAEVIGTAIALNMLFGIPLAIGVLLTVLDVLLILWLQKFGLRYLEAFVIALMAIVFVCFGINLVLARPEWGAVAAGFIPSARTVTDPGMLYLAIGIIGATVMPHNLYLHSSTVQTRRVPAGEAGKRSAIAFATADIMVALALALLVNAAILVTAAAVFHVNGHAAGGRTAGCASPARPADRHGYGRYLVRSRLAGGGTEFVRHCHAGGTGRDGRLRAAAPAALGPPPAHALDRRGAGLPGHAGLWRKRHRQAAAVQPGGAQPAIAVCDGSADPLQQRRAIMGRFASPRPVVVLAWTTMAIIVSLNGILIWRALIG
jgi:manganese transport protein